ncbi:MAG: hypothetical protein MZW92_37210 [Comamonadaceae bacterium]|nr:hypothetical protein [Comamonadaceae bacterium]
MALTAGLALTAFVKAFSMSFLGLARTPGARQATEVGWTMRAGMGLLAAACLVLGLTPTYVVSTLGPVVSGLGAPGGTDALVPPFFMPATLLNPLPTNFVAEFHALGAQIGQSWLPGPGLVLMHRGGPANPVVFASAPSYLGIAILAPALLAWFVTRLATRHRRRTRRRAWDGGLHRLLPQLTYTATGFSNPVRVVFQAVLAPRKPTQDEVIVAEHFRTAITRTENEAYVLDRWLFQPLAAATLRIARLLAGMHHGRLNAYVGYAIVSVIAAMVLRNLW